MLKVENSGEPVLNQRIDEMSDGGLAHLRIKNKLVRSYENVEKPERCPVKLYKKYISLVITFGDIR